jgi:hypothetical protein
MMAAAGLILVVAADAQSFGDRTAAAKLLPGAEEDLQYAWDHLKPSERANLKKDQLAWIKAKDACTDPVQKFHMIQDRTKVICQHLSKEPVTVAKDGHGKEVTVQNTDGSNKSKGYLIAITDNDPDEQDAIDLVQHFRENPPRPPRRRLRVAATLSIKSPDRDFCAYHGIARVDCGCLPGL